MKLYMFRTVRLPIVSSLFTVHSAMLCHTAFEQDQDHPGPAQKLSTNLYDIYHCWVYSEWTADDGQTNCPKQAEFHDKINLWNWCK